MSRIGKLEIELTAGTGNFVRRMKDAELTVTKFGTTFRTGLNVELKAANSIFGTAAKSVLNLKSALIGAGVALGAFKAAQSLNAVAETVDNLGKKAKNLDIPIQQLSILRFTAQESGVDFETLSGLVGKAQKNIGELADGSVTPASKAFKELGIKLKDASGAIRPIGSLLPEIGDKLQDVSSQARKINLASQIFGKSGGIEFVQILEDVDGQFSKMIGSSAELAGQLGVIYNEDQFRRLKAYNDAVGRIGLAWEGVKVKVLSEVAPALADFANDLALGIAKVPATIAAVASAARSLYNQNDPRNALAAADFDKLISAVFIDSGYDAGKAFVLVVGEGLVTTAQVAGVLLSKTLSDTFAGSSIGSSVIKAARSVPLFGIPNVGIGRIGPTAGDVIDYISPPTDVGSQKKLDELKQTRAALIQIADIQKQISALDNRGYVPGDQQVQFDRQRRDLAAQLAIQQSLVVVGGQSIDGLTTQINAQQNELAANAGQTSQKIAAIIRDGFGFSGPAIEELKNKTVNRFKAIGDAIGQIRQDFNTDFVGPPEPEPQRLGRYIDAANRLYEGLVSGVTSVATRIGSQWENIRKLVEAAGQESIALQDRLETAKQNAPTPGDNIFAQQAKERIKLVREQSQEAEKFVQKWQSLSGTIDTGLLGQLTEAQTQEFKNLVDQQTNALQEKANAIKEQFDPRISLNRNLSEAVKLRDSGQLSTEDFERYSDTIQIKIKEIETGLTNFGDQFRDSVKGWGSDAANAFAEVALGAKVSFSDIAASWAKTLLSLTSKQYLFQPLANALGNITGSLLGGSPTITADGGGLLNAGTGTGSGQGVIAVGGTQLINTNVGGLGGLSTNARGNAFMGGVEMFARGGVPNAVISGTAIFPMRNGKVGVAGEKGPEYAAQVARMSDGNLGLRMAGGGGSNVQVNVYDQRGSNSGSVETKDRKGPDGSRIVDVYVREAVGRMAKDGSLDKVLGTSYGVKRTATKR